MEAQFLPLHTTFTTPPFVVSSLVQVWFFPTGRDGISEATNVTPL